MQIIGKQFIISTIGIFIFALALPSPTVSGGDEIFDSFLELSRTLKQGRSTKDKDIKWLGKFVETEKKEFIDYFDKVNRKFELFFKSQVLKDDLDGDGQSEYVVNVLVEDPQPLYFGEVLSIVTRVGKRFDVTVVSGPHSEVKRHRKMEVLDLAGDGLKEIIEQDSWGVHDEEPETSAIIYQTDGIRFRVIYASNNYDFLQFKDLDGNGTVEVLEMGSEVPFSYYAGVEGWWVNIYNWNGTDFERTDSRYLSFYIEKAKYYRGVLNRSVIRNEEYKLKAGEDHPYELKRIRAMREYLRRIELMGMDK